MLQPLVERLEERELLSLLGLNQLDQKPDIASGGRTSMSYIQLGNNDNPFVYSSIPEDIKMPDGSIDNITNQTNHTAAKTTLSLDLDNFGDFVSGGTSPDFSINGHVVIGGTTYDGTLLQAQAQEFGYSNTITTADAEFDVRLAITGGLLTQSGGPYHVGDSLAVLLHQPGLTIGSFPQSFSVSNSLLGSSDTSHLPPQQFCLLTQEPETMETRPPISGPNPIAPITNPDSNAPGTCSTCGAAAAATASSTSDGNLSDTVSEDDGNGTIALYDGAVTMQTTELTIPGRGMNYSLTHDLPQRRRRHRRVLRWLGNELRAAPRGRPVQQPHRVPVRIPRRLDRRRR